MKQSVYEQKTLQSTCPYCGVGCGVDVTCTNSAASELQGTKSHPANLGKLCIKGTNLLQTTSLAGRLLQPEVDGQTASWDQASQRVADEFNRLIAQHGPDAVAFYVSGQLLTEDYYVANKLMKGYIGSANIDTNSRLCMSSSVAAYKRAFGSDTVPCNYDDLARTELLVLVGSNASWTHPVLFQRMMTAKQSNPNLKLVVIDPRRSATAEFADIFLPIKAGSDVALFNGLLHYLVQHHAIDLDFIDTHCENWQQAQSKVEAYDLERVAMLCDLPRASLLAFYESFKNSRSTISFYSQGVNQSHQGVDKCNAIINCHLATGKIGKVGSGPFSITGQPNAMGGREVGGLANMLAAHMNIEDENHRQWVQDFWQSPRIPATSGSKAIELFQDMEAGKIKAVWIMATNPLVSLPNRNRVIKALQRCELVVVSDCVEKNDTLEFARVKFPATTWGEKNGTVTNSERRISRQRSVLPIPGEAKHDWQIICDVANRMGFGQGFDYQHPVEIFTEHAALSALNNGRNGYPARDFDISALQSLTQSQYDNLRPTQWPVNHKYPFGRARMFDDQHFFTPSGKAQFVGVDYQRPPSEHRPSQGFVLNTGRYRDHWHTMTRTGRAVTLAQNSKEPMVAIHPDDAKTLQIEEGQLLWLANDFGEVLLPSVFDLGLRRQNLFAPIHWSEQTSANANLANCFSSRVDPLSGQPDSKNTRVSIRPFDAAVHMHLFSRRLIAVPLSYWSKAKIATGFEYIGAHEFDIPQPLVWCRQHINLEGDWSYFHNEDYTAVLCRREQELLFVGFFSRQKLTIASDWLDSMLGQEAIDNTQASQLLRLDVPDEFSKGKIICSCHRVGENEILAKIQDEGLETLEALAEALKCGTNCGSCKGEINALINNEIKNPNKNTEQPLIPIKVDYS